MDFFDLLGTVAWLRYFLLCQHLKLDMKAIRYKRSLVFVYFVLFGFTGCRNGVEFLLPDSVDFMLNSC